MILFNAYWFFTLKKALVTYKEKCVKRLRLRHEY